MKSYINVDLLFERLNISQKKAYNFLVERMELNNKELTDAEKESLCYMACDLEDLSKCSKGYLCQVFLLNKRIERSDIRWLPRWKHIHDEESNLTTKYLLFEMALMGVIYEDLRKGLGISGDDCDDYYNARRSVSEIHEDYAMILGVDVEDVSYAIRYLEEHRYIRKVNCYKSYLTYRKSGQKISIFRGVVYVPCMTYNTGRRLWTLRKL